MFSGYLLSRDKPCSGPQSPRSPRYCSHKRSFWKVTTSSEFCPSTFLLIIDSPHFTFTFTSTVATWLSPPCRSSAESRMPPAPSSPRHPVPVARLQDMFLDEPPKPTLSRSMKRMTMSRTRVQSTRPPLGHLGSYRIEALSGRPWRARAGLALKRARMDQTLKTRTSPEIDTT